MTAAPARLPAGAERRLLAFALDRLLAVAAYAVAVWLAWTLSWGGGGLWPGVATVAATVVGVWLVSSTVLGLRGTSPGRAATGLRVVSASTGRPLGVGPALLRGLVLGVATLPTAGLGTAALALSAVTDRDGRRRGWHDHLTGSVVVEDRAEAPAADEEPAPAPAAMVNLTAMRLVPADPLATPASPAGPDRGEQAGRPLPGTREPTTPAARLRAGPGSRDASAGPRTSLRGAGATGGSRWRVAFDTGEALVVEGPVLVGRQPAPRPGEQVRHVVALPSEDMSLSKTHARVHLADGVLVVMDRGSTNGSVLDRRGVVRDLPAGRPTTLVDGDRVRFGDREMRVERHP